MKRNRKKWRAGNYLKKYPHIYAEYEKKIKVQHLAIGFLFLVWILLLLFLFYWIAAGARQGIIFWAILMLIVAAVLGFSRFGMERADSGELEMIERELAGEKEKIPDWSSCYSTKDSLILGLNRVPRKGLSAVRYRVQYTKAPRIKLDFQYADGTCIAVDCFGDGRYYADVKELIGAVRKYDTDIEIYNHEDKG